MSVHLITPAGMLSTRFTDSAGGRTAAHGSLWQMFERAALLLRRDGVVTVALDGDPDNMDVLQYELAGIVTTAGLKHVRFEWDWPWLTIIRLSRVERFRLRLWKKGWETASWLMAKVAPTRTQG